MRVPARKIWLYLVLLLAGVALVYFPAMRLGAEGKDWWLGAIAIAGLLLSVISAVQLVTAILFARGQSKLARGIDILARWTVTADEWERFRAFDRIRASTDAGLGNDLALGEAMLGKSVDVLVGRKSALIGDSYHVLRKWGLPGLVGLYWLPPPADPECLEFHISYPRGRGGALLMSLRFPVPTRYRAEGIKVFNHFAPMLERRPAIALRRPRATIVVGLLAASFGASAFVWGIHQPRTGADSAWPLGIAVISAIFGLGGLLVAILTLILTRRRTSVT